MTSLDRDPQVTERARTTHARLGSTRVMFFATDPRAGWQLAAPYRVIISWRTLSRLPHAWLRQCQPLESAIITPAVLASSRATLGWLRIEVDEERQPIRPHLLPEASAAGSTYETAVAVRLHGDPDGYTAHLDRGGAR